MNLLKRSTKYVALDVHQATIVTSVREESGRVIARTVLPTEATAIVERCRLFHPTRFRIYFLFFDAFGV